MTAALRLVALSMSFNPFAISKADLDSAETSEQFTDHRVSSSAGSAVPSA
jgi:hypothetical protein